MMDYSHTIDYLFSQMPMFQRQGAGAYKPGLETARALSEAFGNPHESLRVIHVGGTNGKGSTSHTIASVLQKAGYRVGLYTSPHLVDFRERIRVDGEMIPEEAVVDFVERFREMKLDTEWAPSFFELTTIMAFEYFARRAVDFAVIEVGLGGRLDTTNIVSPLLSIITNISLDHVALLGDTPAMIAVEKAGIIKRGVPVVIGEADDPDVRKVFAEKATELGSPIVFADDTPVAFDIDEKSRFVYHTDRWGDVVGELSGDCQNRNANTVFHALDILESCGIEISDEAVIDGFAAVTETTGLMGRWMKLSDNPLTVCDTGHNTGGWQYLAPRLSQEAAARNRLFMVVGFVNDKDISHILDMMPKADNVDYLFVQPSVERGLDACKLAEIAATKGISGRWFPSVVEGYDAAMREATPGDMIFVGGSTFVVADLLSAGIR